MKKGLLNLILIISSVITSNASHLIGGDMTYKCLGGNDYRIILTLYRDCSGVDLLTTQDIQITSSCGGQTLTLNEIDLSPNNPSTNGMTDTSYLCSSYINQTTCSNGSYPGVEIHKYTADINLPDCADWTFSWSSCCRNPAYSYPAVNDCGQSFPDAITRVNNPSSLGQAFVATMDNSDGACNSSPNFNFTPRAFICQGQEIYMDHGGTDPDGDSLVYSLVAPLENLTDTITYTTGFSSQNPITVVPGTTFDIHPQTGTMLIYPQNFGIACNNPDSVEQSSMAVQVSQYRNGVLVGTTIRDIQIVTLPGCEPLNAFSAGITDISVATNFINDSTVYVCAGDTLEFSVTIVDTSNLDSFSIRTNFKDFVPNASFSSSGANPVIGTFYVTPTNNDVGFYSFIVEASNNTCPVTITNVFNMYIEVFGATVADVSIDTTCVGQGDSLTLTVEGGQSFVWATLNPEDSTQLSDSTWAECDTCPVTKILPPHTVDYVVTSDLDTYGCPYIDTVHVERVPLIKPLENRDICYEDSTFLMIEWEWNPTNAVYYEWNEDDNFDDTIFYTNQPGTYFYLVQDTVDYTDSVFCTWRDTAEVVVVDCPVSLPNIFTPNGEDGNDIYFIDNIENKVWNLSVYNRWGKLVYEALDYQNDWKAEGLADGTYYCIITNQDGGTLTTLKNWVVITR